MMGDSSLPGGDSSVAGDGRSDTWPDGGICGGVSGLFAGACCEREGESGFGV